MQDPIDQVSAGYPGGVVCAGANMHRFRLSGRFLV